MLVYFLHSLKINNIMFVMLQMYTCVGVNISIIITVRIVYNNVLVSILVYNCVRIVYNNYYHTHLLHY